MKPPVIHPVVVLRSLSHHSVNHPSRNYFVWWRQTKRGESRAKIKPNQRDPQAGTQAPGECTSSFFSEAETMFRCFSNFAPQHGADFPFSGWKTHNKLNRLSMVLDWATQTVWSNAKIVLDLIRMNLNMFQKRYSIFKYLMP